MKALTLLRFSAMMLGVVMCGFGVFQFIDRTSPGVQDAIDILVWLAAAIALHDGLLVPLVLVVGLLIVRFARLSGALRGGLLCAACLTLVALPMMLRQGESANPTVLPHDYVTNWVVTIAATVVVTAGVAWFGRRRARDTQRREEMALR
ncbi:hypothetical protein [Streptomyces sp. 049-1]|uniref:hypothetical protein n=1 Tax=Streptomyces sp. 049-1 TaxID=2789264 RepID=UPI00397F2CBC